ncbi:MAG: GatB/YqeY domain-containing protein [Clostridia bacterium]|nr:GatB/YqeY domain-containing protein [Clostridia bacterium]MBQ6937427.1 GatB/YqeY domain-containing protein [Clostridia bacterium]
MTLQELQKDMIAAMKAKDKVRKDVISSLIAAVKKYGIDNGVRNDITEEMTDSVLLKELKTAKEQLDTCPAERTDLLETYKTNYGIIQEYVPAQLSEEEIIALLTEKYSELIATKNKGMIMKTVMAELKGKADGKVISEAVAKLCK